ncbi:MAG: L-threonylcarbamoyladenylate synthase [Dehalococcoidia bacterium]
MECNLETAVSVVNEGGVIVYPTDTVYGLGADAENRTAVERIYRIKKRPIDQPLSILLADALELFRVSSAIPDVAWILAEHFWPGGLTMVVEKSTFIPGWVTSGGNTVAVRVPDHPLTIRLIRETGMPLIGTSANFSGLPSATTAEEARRQLGGDIDFILDGGRCPGGIESTVVDVTGQNPVILREGSIPTGLIEAVCRLSLRE